MILALSSDLVNRSPSAQDEPVITAQTGNPNDPGDIAPDGVPEPASSTDDPTPSESADGGAGETPDPAAKRLTELAASINDHHSQAAGFTRQALKHARITGEELVEAKALTGHGRFKEWVAAHCRCSFRTAQRYMRVARNWERLAPKVTEMTLLTITDAINELSHEDADDAEDAREAEDVEDDAGDEDADENDEDEADDTHDGEDVDDGGAAAKAAALKAAAAEVLAAGAPGSNTARTGNPVEYLFGVMADGQPHPDPSQWEIPLTADLRAYLLESRLLREQAKRAKWLKNADDVGSFQDWGRRTIVQAFWNVYWAGLIEQVGNDEAPRYQATERGLAVAQDILNAEN